MDTITVPKEFLLDLLSIYARLPRNDISTNQAGPSMRRLCKKTGVKEDLADYFVEIVSPNRK